MNTMNPDPSNPPEPESSTEASMAESGAEDRGEIEQSAETGPEYTAVPAEKQHIPATIGLIVLILFVYGFTAYPTFNTPSKLALYWGSFFPSAINNGEWWRFFTATLMHGNPSHLFNNVFGILIFGQFLERVIGSFRLVILYIISAFCGLALSYFLLPNSITIGASTIDYGLIGAYFGIVLLIRYQVDRAVFKQELRGAIIFVILFVSWNTMQMGEVNLWGHIGGFLGGILFAFWLYDKRRKQMGD